MRRALFSIVSLLLLLPLFLSGCSEITGGSGWSSSELRPLTAEEKETVIDMALNTPQALSQLETTDVYETEISWMAEIYDDSGIHSWRAFEYGIVESGVPEDVPESAVFYPQVYIVFGEPIQWQSQTVVDLETGEVVLLLDFPPRGINVDGQ